MKKQIRTVMIAFTLLLAALVPVQAAVQALDSNPYGLVAPPTGTPSGWTGVLIWLGSLFGG